MPPDPLPGIIDPRGLAAAEIPEPLLLRHYLPEPHTFRHPDVLAGALAWEPIDAVTGYLEGLDPDASPEVRQALAAVGMTTLRQGQIEGRIMVEEGAEIEPFVVIRALQGRLYIGPGVRIGAFTRIEVEGGDLYLHEGACLQTGCDLTGWGAIGAGSVIVGSLLRGKVMVGRENRIRRATLLGPCCVGDHCDIRPGAFLREYSLFGDRVEFRSESKNAILMDGIRDSGYLTAADHYAYIGDSLIGPAVNLGAGTITSNLKVDRSPVTITLEGARYTTGRVKLGGVVGALAQLGCHTILDPGALIGPETLTYPGALLRGYYPPRSIVKVRQQQEVVRRR